MVTRTVREAAEEAFKKAQNQPDDWTMPAGERALIQPSEGSDIETAADRVAIALDQVAGDDRAYVRLWRMNEGSERTFCEDFTPQQFEEGGLTLIRERWGSGRFFIALYGTVPGTKRFTIRTKGEVTIAEMRNAPPPMHVAPGNNEMSVALRGIMETQKAMLEAITQRPQVDPMENMRNTMQMVALMRDAFGPAQAQSKSSIGEIVEAIKELQAVSKLVNPPQEEKEGDLLSLGAKALELIKTAIPPQQSSLPIQPVAIPQSIASTVPQATSPSDSQPETNSEQMIAEFRALLAEMITRAKANAPLKEAAEFLYEKLPEELDELILSDQWFLALSQVAPEVRQHEVWIRDVHAELLSIYREEQASDGDMAALEQPG